MMKKIALIGLMLCCQTTYANLQPETCVQVVSQSEYDGVQKYHLLIHNKIIYQCPNNTYFINDKCQPVFGSFGIDDYIDNYKRMADKIYHTSEEVLKAGFKFDKYNLAFGYINSLWIPIYASKELNYPLTFKNNLLILNFPKEHQYTIGAYPRGMLRPINYMFIQEKLKKAVIRQYKGKITRATFTTDKNERFQYRLDYKGDKLIKSQILYQKSPKAVWQVDSSESYHYKQCRT